MFILLLLLEILIDHYWISGDEVTAFNKMLLCDTIRAALTRPDQSEVIKDLATILRVVPKAIDDSYKV